LNIQEFKSLHDKITINVLGDKEMEETIASQLVAIYHNEIDSQNYLEWLTINTRILDMAEEVKSVQRTINHSPVQRRLLRVPKEEKLTQKVRLMRANLPLYRRGIVTFEQVRNKEYMFHVQDLSSKNNSLEDSSKDLNSVLTSKEKLVVYLYFGFHTDDSKSIGQIAAFMDVSSTDVQQILKDALVKMQAHLNDFT
jgi:DNA-directed RNA polymerase specialized sigma subunit